MSNAEYRRKTRAGRLMYELGYSREHADAITHAIPYYTESVLIDYVAKFERYELTHEEAVGWLQQEVIPAATAAEWTRRGWTPQQYAVLSHWYRTRSATVPRKFVDSIRNSGVSAEFVVLAIKAGAHDHRELDDWIRQDEAGGDIRATLTMLAGHAD